MAKVTFEEYFAFLERLGKTLEELTGLAKKKTAAVRQDDLRTVDACMRREQALSLSLRSMDKKREEMLAGLGLSGAPLSDLSERCPEEYRLQAKKAQETLRSQFQLYRSSAEVARTTLECNLHQLEKCIEEASGRPARPGGGLADVRA